jgi:hypothetical protein
VGRGSVDIDRRGFVGPFQVILRCSSGVGGVLRREMWGEGRGIRRHDEGRGRNRRIVWIRRHVRRVWVSKEGRDMGRGGGGAERVHAARHREHEEGERRE